MRKRDPREAVERLTGRLLSQNTAARAAWEKQDPSAGDSKRPQKLTPDEASKRAEQVARRHHGREDG